MITTHLGGNLEVSIKILKAYAFQSSKLISKK